MLFDLICSAVYRLPNLYSFLQRELRIMCLVGDFTHSINMLHTYAVHNISE